MFKNFNFKNLDLNTRPERSRRENFKLKISNLVIIIIISLYFLFPVPAHGAGFDLSISPPILTVMMMPGKTITQVYYVTNNGSSLELFTDVLAFDQVDNLGHVELDVFSYKPKPDWLNWFSLQNADISLGGKTLIKARETVQLVLKIKVPENAPEKDYYASLILKSRPDEKLLGQSGALASGMIGSHILLSVSRDGKPPLSGVVSDLSVKEGLFSKFIAPIFDSFDKIYFTLKVTNTGNTMFRPEGTVKIISPLNNEADSLAILPQNILAHSERQLFQVSNDDNYQKDLSWQPRGLQIGKYKAKAEFDLGNGQKISQETSFFVFPWKLMLAVLGFVLVLQLIKKLLFH